MTNIQSIKARFGIVGTSPLLDAALSTAVRVAPTDLTVLITGESGVGKEAFSKIIHQLSARKHSEFIAVNCGAIPEGTINSELFGHEKGAFTGALGERKGYFETVDGGTIFLDEIGEMPPDTQAYLLRVLENGEFIRVGSSKVLKTDVRVVAATNVDLQERIRKGKFRDDLYYRLNTVPIHVPALHERRDDILLLFRKFAHDFAEKYRTEPVRLDEQAEQIFYDYRWPGNVRELRNAAEQLSILSESRRIGIEEIRRHMPHLMVRSLPVAYNDAGGSESTAGNFTERDVLYKILFDMRNDINDLKSLIFELVQQNDLHLPDQTVLKGMANSLLPADSRLPTTDYRLPTADRPLPTTDYRLPTADSRQPTADKPRIISQPVSARDTVEVHDADDEPLAMDEIEKEAIKRALKKYNGRRKEAAEELKISERTLYRKIKMYDL
ncbi:MAG: sigma-54 dependent transcriptional regulator [Saprospiraceae bacterium]|nr:sigma-54 dependent transcriptional regulator [Saprospiraceae bacterium]